MTRTRWLYWVDPLRFSGRSPTGELGNLRYGVALARRGGWRRKGLLDTLPFRRFREAVRPLNA
jgi:hypothetical protein